MSGYDPMMDQSSAIIDTKKALVSNSMVILGDENQVLKVVLQPHEEILAEPGSMMSTDDDIIAEVQESTCEERCFRECCAEESGRRIVWTNQGSVPQSVLFAPTLGKVVPINLDEHGGEMYYKAGSFLCSLDTELDFDIVSSTGSGGAAATKAAKGGQLYYVKVIGSGWVFLNSAGAIYTRYLEHGETIVADRGHILAWDTSVDRRSRRSGSVSMIFCGGEGYSNATFTGPGQVILNSDPRVGVPCE